MLYHN